MNNIVDTTHELISYASSNRNRISKIFINSLLIFVVCAIFGCFDFVNFSIDISLLRTWRYWTTIISKTIGYSIIFNVGINLMFDKEVQSDTKLEEQRIKYNNLNGKKVEQTFNRYVDTIFNREQKKKAYKSYINRKIYWLNKFSSNKSKLLYSSDREEEKLKDGYCIRRKELEELKTEEYIENNIDSIIIKYQKVDPILFELEIDGKGTYKGIKVRGNVNEGRAKFTGSVIAGVVAFSMVFASIVLAPDQKEFSNQMVRFWHYVLSCCGDAGMLLWQLFRGMIKARPLVSQELTEPLVGRNYVLESYYKWCGDNQDNITVGEQLSKLCGKES